MALAAQTSRLFYFDWLRVLAFGLLVPYHAGLMFVDWGFHIQNAGLTEDLKPPMLFVNQWRLPLLFFVAGVGTRFALRRRPGRVFLQDRLRRLGIPLVAGILLVIPPQTYLERLSHGVSYPSYLGFYPHFFEAGNFTWNHLWFIVYLLAYSVLLLPVFLWLRRRNEAGSRGAGAGFWTGHYRLLGLVVPLVLIEVLLRSRWPDTRNLVADWYNFAFYLTFLLYGFVLSLSEWVWPQVEQNRWGYLAVGAVSSALIYVGWHSPGEGFLETTTAGWLAFCVFKCLNIWGWILCFIGFARHHLQRSNAFLAYTNEAVYPFYILHQTVLIILGYYVLQWSAGIAIKYAVIVAGTFAGTAFLYEFVVRRVGILRLLFGLKPAPDPEAAPELRRVNPG
ncbi:acyltransferase family protein [Hymenobacter sp.]|uniref:acyltransferase family protein n=1 Tax=Hymenobacter sp. TaxID=1898978 RepID=UPI00286BB34A|nr:acyltransferase family protein [Hymenobacter sp.]